MKFSINFILCFLLVVNTVFAQKEYPFRDADLGVDVRIKDLMHRLTVEEKISLLLYNSPEIERLGVARYNWWNESLHGIGRAGMATVFPQSIALAATFDSNLVFRVATAISDEARAKYNGFRRKGVAEQYAGLTFWSPNVNIFRDPRWGRGQETYGEDPFLTGVMGVNYVRGMQGDNGTYLKTAACAKHFAVHSGPEESRHRFNALPSDRDLYDTYLPAFKRLSDAGVEAFMCAYNQLNNHPCCANEFLLKEVLRKQWGFKGHIVSDCWAISDFVKFQNYSKNETEAAALSILAGVNLNCGSCYKNLGEAIKNKLLSEKDIDNALIPVLKTRFKLGMFDTIGANPYDKIGEEVVNCKKHVALAYEAACKSIVLLSNKNNVLPLDANKVGKLFVTGPMAADMVALMGNYNGFSGNMVTPLEGIVGSVGVNTVVDYTLGTTLINSTKYNGVWQATGADVVVVFLGNNSLVEGEDGDAMMNDKGGDRVMIELPENQIELVRKLKNEAKPKKLVVVLSGGSAIACKEVVDLADAVLFNWYSGEQGGNAIADVLFGKVNPSGKLPVTFYKATSDLPSFDDYSMQNRTYRYFKGSVLFPFGYGLSYSTFEYTDTQVVYDKKEKKIIVSGAVKNISGRDGIEVVQVYARYLKNEALNKKLVGFVPVEVKAGDTQLFKVSVSLNDLKLYHEQNKKYEMSSQDLLIQIGESSERIIKELNVSLR